MNCGCKKTLCDKKTCKCKKNSVYCSDNCSCQSERCKNRQEKVENENVVNELSWDDVNRISQNWLEMINRERQKANQTIPGAITSVLLMQSRVLQEIDDLNAAMARLALEKGEMNVDEYERFSQNLVQCKACKRKFTPQRIEIHEKICTRRTYTY